jgi:hypothetical protein
LVCVKFFSVFFSISIVFSNIFVGFCKNTSKTVYRLYLI